MWNQAGVRPDACDVLERIAQESDLQARVWKGPGLPEEKQGMKVSGAPLGRPSFVHAFLVKKIEDQRTLLDRIPLLADLQASWLLLLHCAAARANYLLRVVEPGAAAQYVSSHEGLRTCLCAISPDLGDERRNNHAFGSGRDWTAQRNAYKDTRILGQLVSFVDHDSCSSLGSGFPVRGCSGAKRWRSMSDGSC